MSIFRAQSNNICLQWYMLSLTIIKNNKLFIEEGTWWNGNLTLEKKKLWKDAHISNFPRSKRTLKHMCGAKITARGSCVCKLFKVFQLFTCLKYAQSTLQFTQADDIVFVWHLNELYINRLSKTIVIISENFLTAGRLHYGSTVQIFGASLILSLIFLKNKHLFSTKTHQ